MEIEYRKVMDLTQMRQGKTGTVKEIRGGHGVIRKLHIMGVRPGKKITKISSQFLRGPQTISVDNMQLAVGFGIAKKILIETDE